MNRTLQSLCNRNGSTKRIRTIKEARASLEAGWAEKFGEQWCVAEEDCHRCANKTEALLLTKAQKVETK